MKQLKYLAAGIVMMCAVFLFPEKAFAAESVSVTRVADITDVQNVTSTNYNVGKGEYEKVVQFTIAKPSYVYVSAYSTVSDGTWGNLGIIDEFMVYSDAKCSNLVYNGENQSISKNQKKSKYMCLDAGTYWIRFAKGRNNDYNDTSEGQFRLSVAAQYISPTATKNGSWARAKSISTDKKVTGFLSNSTRTSWFKFKVSSGTIAKLTLSLENPMGESEFPTSPTGVTVYRSNHRKVGSLNIGDNYYNAVDSKSLNLTSGTYYIAVTGDSSYGSSIWSSKVKLRKNEYRNMGVVNLRVTTVKKTAVSKLTNVRGKKAQVTYKKITGAKGYEIQYTTDKKFKKSVKTIRANSKTTKVTLKSLKKNKYYYVRVRAYKYDDNGKKVAGNYSTVKKVKIKK